MAKFSVSEALRYGWTTTTANLWYLAGLAVLMVLVSWLPGFIVDHGGDSLGFASLIVMLAAWVLQLGMSIGLIAVVLKIIDGMVPPMSEVFNHFNLFFRYLGASLLYSLIVFLGLILLIVPGVIWSLKYSLFAYYIVDKNVGVMESLHLSGVATQGAKGTLFLLFIMAALVNLVGILALGIGLLVTMPMTMLAYAWVYRKLSSGMAALEVPAVPPPPVPMQLR